MINAPKTMSLIGGIDEYGVPGARFKSDEPPYGRHVRFGAKNGYEDELERAKMLFKKDEVLTVREILVGRSSSKVEFIEHPNLQFNTVMFYDYEEVKN